MKLDKAIKSKISLWYLFAFWALLFAMYTICCVVAFYPGNISVDGLNQLIQINLSEYSNHHSFFHTQIINLFWIIGNSLFHDCNIAIFIYFIFQIILFSFSISFSLFILLKWGINKFVALIFCIWYCVMPIFIIFSFTLYKDVFFSSCIVLLTFSLFSYFKKLYVNKIINFIIVVFSSLGICLLRSNGIIVFLIILITFLIMFIGKTYYKKIAISGISIFVLCLLLLFPFLNMINVKQADIVEHLSIPIQQVSRVIVDCDDLDNNQKALITDIVNWKDIQNSFVKSNADGMKNAIRNKNQQNVIIEKLPQFISLYCQLGLKHPDKYMAEWIDMTKGYYNSYYEEHLYDVGVIDNDFGLKMITSNSMHHFILDEINFLKTYFPILFCIGIFTWLLLISMCLAICKKDKQILFCCIPSIAVFISLLLSTPLYCEYRYALAIVLIAPLLFTASLISIHYKKYDFIYDKI